MLWPKPNCLILDPADGLTDANRWAESSGNGLNPLPNVNYAAPAYGLAIGPSGAPYILANGVNQLATLPLWFYTRAPTTGITVALVQKFTSPFANDIIFDCTNVAATRGLAIELPVAERLSIRAYDAAGAVMRCTMTADGPLTGRTRVVVLAMEQAGSLARVWLDGQGVAATFAGSLLPIAYDVATVPLLFRSTGGAWGYNDASVYTVQIDNRVWTDSEALAFSAYWMDRT